MSAFLTNPCFRRIMPPVKRRPWELHDELVYASDILGHELRVPAGYRTDFASIPWLFRRVFPQDGPWTLAAVLHDFLCDTRPLDTNHVIAAKLMVEAMEVLGVAPWKRKAIYRAVVWFGPKWEVRVMGDHN